ncbi:NAD(P)/FAD-dependent oxidoreductase [Terasakiella sp.]|uniref:NAD(P)/FAD-dependent oxidoreductase n=1 Tax=Terasakiella sp. TaxID=2034861 RepID=UPI003AA7CAD7
MNKHVTIKKALDAYDPRFDPLVQPTPGHNQDYAPTYWVAHGGDAPQDDGPVMQDMDVDVAIIGSGFTGLACAVFLAQEHGIKAHVLEANQVSWGCTSRNGGQAQNNSGRLKRSQWIKQWGLETALKLHKDIEEGFETFEELIKDIDCDAVNAGHLYVAHRPKVLKTLEAEVELMNKTFGYKSRMVSKEELHSDWVKEANGHGAMLEPTGIGVQPVKVAYGYHRKARALGAKIHTSSPVEGWETINGVHHLRTPGGIVRARAVAVATGGYTTQTLHKSLKNRFMPIMSNNMVTRKLSDAEVEACGFKSNIIMTDTRTLRHYYRLLPDQRLQIGSRSAITGADAGNRKHFERLVAGKDAKFPALKGIDIDYSWWGWVDVSHDMMPRIFQPNAQEQIFYALGYGGNGVMSSAHAGRRMAQLVAGKPIPKELPIYNSPLPYEVFAPFRRIGQRMLYVWYGLRDNYL